MKVILAALTAASLVTGIATIAVAQEKTVIHKESADGEHSKTIVKHGDGSKTVIKRHGLRMKKIHTEPNGDKTVIKKDAD